MRWWVVAGLVALAGCGANAAPSTVSTGDALEDAGRDADATAGDAAVDADVPVLAQWVQTPLRAPWIDREPPTREPVLEVDRFDPDELHMLLSWVDPDGAFDTLIAVWNAPADARFGVAGVGPIDRATGELTYGVRADDRSLRSVMRYRSEPEPNAEPTREDLEMRLQACPTDEGRPLERLQYFLVPETGMLIQECAGDSDETSRYGLDTGEEFLAASLFGELQAVGFHGLTLWAQDRELYLVDAEGYAIQPVETVLGLGPFRAVEGGFMLIRTEEKLTSDNPHITRTHIEVITLRSDGSVEREAFPPIVFEDLPLLDCAFRGEREVICVETRAHIVDEATEILFYRHTLGSGQLSIERIALPVLHGGRTQFQSFAAGFL